MTGRTRAAVGVVVLALVAIGALGWWQALDRGRTDRTRAAVAEAATTFASGMMTYAHDDLDALREHVADGATPAFADTVTSTLDGELGTEITDTEASSTATVDRVLVELGGDGRAHAVVVLDTAITSTAGTRELTDLYVELALVRREGRWLVDDLTRLAARGGEG